MSEYFVSGLEERGKTVFKRAHSGDYKDLSDEVAAFFEDTLKAADDLGKKFKNMMERKFDDELIKAEKNRAQGVYQEWPVSFSPVILGLYNLIYSVI